MNYSNSQRAGVILYLTALIFGAYVLCVEYGDIPKENDMIIIEVDDGRLYAVIAARIADIEIV